MEKREPTREELSAKIRTLEERLWEAEQTIEAIQSGEVDALVIHKPDGEQLYTLTGADHGYRVLVESVVEGALILSSDDSIYYCNRTLGEMLQLPIQKIISSRLDSYVAAEARPQLMGLIKESRSFGEAKGELLMKRNDGTLLPVNVSLNRLSLEDFEGVCAVITDLSEQKQVEEELRRHRTELESLVDERTADLARTNAELQQEIIERKRAEEELHRSREWFRVTLSSIGDAVIATDASGLVTFLNPMGAQLTGWQLEEAVGQPIQSVFKIFNEKTRKSAENIVERVLLEGSIVSLVNDTVLVTRDGREIPIENSAAPITDNAGNLIGVVLVFHDVTAKRRSEEALLESQKKYHTLFTSLIEGFCIIEMVFDAAGRPVDYRFLEINPKFEQQTGLRDVEGKLMRDLAPDNEAHWFEIYGNIALTGEPARFVNEAKALNRWYDVSAFRFGGPESRKVAICFNDITERKQAEEKVRYQNDILETINQIFYKALTCETEQQLGATCLKAAEELTQSKYGFIGEFDADGSLYDISISDPGWEACAMYDQSGHRRPPLCFKIHGLYGRVLVDGKSLLTNDPKSHPDSIGTPSEHPPLTAFLGVPLIHNRKTIGILGLANREGGYTPEHQQAVEAITPAIVEAFFRKRVETELRENRSQLDLALRSAQMGVWHLDLIENKRHFDDQVCHLLGIDPAEFTGTTEEFYKAVHPDDREMLRSALARTIENDVPYETEYRAVWPDGSVHYIIARAKIFHNDIGQPLRINGLLWDITERKRMEHVIRKARDELEIRVQERTRELVMAEEALQRANRALRTINACNEALIRNIEEQDLLNHVCEIIVQVGGYRMAWVGLAEPDGKKKVRPLAYAGYDEGYLEAADISWADTERGRGPTGLAIREGKIHIGRNTQTQPNLAPWRAEALRRGYASSIALPLVVNTRTYGALTIYSSEPDAFNEEETKLLASLADDLSYGIASIQAQIERKQAEEKIARASTMLETVFDGISDPLLMVETDCRIRMLNEAAGKYFHLADSEDVIAKTCYEMTLGRCGPCDSCDITSAILEGKRTTFERKGVFAPERIEQITVYPVNEIISGVSGAIVRISDITESRNMEKHLTRVDRLSSLGMLAGGIAHEIRNPLQGITLFIDVLGDEERFSRTSQERVILAEVKSNIKRIDGIIRRTLDFSRESKTAALKNVDLSVLIEDSLKLWRSRMAQDGIQLKLLIEENLSEVLGDPIEIQQVLTNLVQNAVEAIEKNGTLSIGAQNGILSFDKKRPAVIIKVQDSGPGIPIDRQQNIFNPFFTSKPTGTGLGLAISHRIVSRHGGLLSFESVPGVGTTFSVELPAALGS